MVKWVLLFSFILFFTRCNENNTSCINAGVIKVANNLHKFQILNLSDYVSSIEYIPLETNDSVLIGEISQIAYEKGNIVILNSPYQCLIFNNDGSYRCCLGHQGEGPNEYLLIHSFDINPTNQAILMYAYYHKYFEYDMNGKLKRRVPYPAYPADYQATNAMYISVDTFFSDIVSYSSIHYKGIVFSSSSDSSKVIKTYPVNHPIEKENSSFSLTFEVARMCRSENSLFYYKVLNDTIFTIDSDMNLKKAYLFDMDKFKATPEWCLGYTKENSGDYVWPENLYVSSKYLFIDFFLAKYAPEPFEYIEKFGDGHEVKMISSEVKGIYNRETGELQFLLQPLKKKLGLKNDLDDGPVAIWPKYISTDGKLVTFCSAEEFLEYYESLDNPSEKIKKVVEGLKPDDNPVVIVASLKK